MVRIKVPVSLQGHYFSAQTAPTSPLLSGTAPEKPPPKEQLSPNNGVHQWEPSEKGVTRLPILPLQLSGTLTGVTHNTMLEKGKVDGSC